MREDLIRMKQRARELDARRQLEEAHTGRKANDQAQESPAGQDDPKAYVSSSGRLNFGLRIQLSKMLQQ